MSIWSTYYWEMVTHLATLRNWNLEAWNIWRNNILRRNIVMSHWAIGEKLRTNQFDIKSTNSGFAASERLRNVKSFDKIPQKWKKSRDSLEHGESPVEICTGSQIEVDSRCSESLFLWEWPASVWMNADSAFGQHEYSIWTMLYVTIHIVCCCVRQNGTKTLGPSVVHKEPHISIILVIPLKLDHKAYNMWHYSIQFASGHTMELCLVAEVDYSKWENCPMQLLKSRAINCWQISTGLAASAVREQSSCLMLVRVCC